MRRTSSSLTRLLVAGLACACLPSAACTFSPSPLDPIGVDAALAPDADIGSDAPLPVIDAGPDDGGIDAPPPPELIDIAHLAAEDEWPGLASLQLDNGASIDTTALTINGMPYPGVEGDDIVFESVAQEGSGPELAVLRVSALTVNNGTVRVLGARPLLVIASGEITLDGVLDASADFATPGPGGAAQSEGDGRGGDGSSDDNLDTGGGGAGFGGGGGEGGESDDCIICPSRGRPGEPYGVPSLVPLQGGSGGGDGAIDRSCAKAAGGAGGGAVQISSSTSIRIAPNSGVHTGGGGGRGGSIEDDGCPEDTSGSGAGGGSGGAIYLQAPMIEHRGVLAANGGSGGSGGGGNNRNHGENGAFSAASAPGGQSPDDNFGGTGGNGGALDVGAEVGRGGETNGGGGGGAVGRIVLRTAEGGLDENGGSTTSPAPARLTQ
ncbi:hypothetical protein [Haliangium ochraceum]|uniref:PE-PGRS family protein n=1 Tax=Haliangium ochraceum (strain DSM 14365 / JCM 11303 / SMP-2) TaxID=502025 RepID=D0LG29_HALO1|nr:hypothetical protein [Haliangium ochraceum]ACY14631.1 hypothetical protein Hoch_2086 [Haliangium ochraceum DSM 14365]